MKKKLWKVDLTFPETLEVPKDQCRTYFRARTSNEVRRMMSRRYPEAEKVAVSLVRS